MQLQIKRTDGTQVQLELALGECLFVVGANGSGKSSLMSHLYAQHRDYSRRISAHRQTWFTSNSVTLTGEQKRQIDQQILSYDAQVSARWMDQHSGARAGIAIYGLIDAENVRARRIAAAVDARTPDQALIIAEQSAPPIREISDLLRLANVPIRLVVRENEQVFASKHGGPEYSVTELSDGERNALLIAAEILTAKPGTLFLVDEPERHLHRSIISPLLLLLFRKRQDCAFIVSTHDVGLPLDAPEAQTVLVRSCRYSGSEAQDWEVDLLPRNAPLDETLRRDILGSRRSLVFIEGTSQSLDHALYSLLFPSISIIPKASCRDVEQAVVGLRGAPDAHWVQAFGVVDNDGRPSLDLAALEERGIFSLSVFSVESIYYHPEVQRRVAMSLSKVTGQTPEALVGEAAAAALSAIAPHAERLSQRVAEKRISAEVQGQLPTQQRIAEGGILNIEVDVARLVEEEKALLNGMLVSADLAGLIGRYPVRETSALAEIAKRLGFQTRSQYEGAVRTLVGNDESALQFMRSFFGRLPERLGLPSDRAA